MRFMLGTSFSGENNMNDHQRILEWLADGEWKCSTELDYMRDARKRMSELNEPYPKDEPLIDGIPCDGRCNTIHKSKNLKMRRLTQKKSLGVVLPPQQEIDNQIKQLSLV